MSDLCFQAEQGAEEGVGGNAFDPRHILGMTACCGDNLPLVTNTVGEESGKMTDPCGRRRRSLNHNMMKCFEELRAFSISFDERGSTQPMVPLGRDALATKKEGGMFRSFKLGEEDRFCIHRNKDGLLESPRTFLHIDISETSPTMSISSEVYASPRALARAKNKTGEGGGCVWRERPVSNGSVFRRS